MNEGVQRAEAEQEDDESSSASFARRSFKSRRSSSVLYGMTDESTESAREDTLVRIVVTAAERQVSQKIDASMCRHVPSAREPRHVPLALLTI